MAGSIRAIARAAISLRVRTAAALSVAGLLTAVVISACANGQSGRDPQGTQTAQARAIETGTPTLALEQQMETLVTAWLNDDRSNTTVQIIDSGQTYPQLGKELYPREFVGIPIYQRKTAGGQFRVVSLTRGPDGKHAVIVTTFGNDQLLGLQVPGYANGVGIDQNESGSLSLVGGVDHLTSFGIVHDGDTAMADLQTLEALNFPADIRILDFDPAKIPVTLPQALTNFYESHYQAGEADTKWSEGGPQPANVVTKTQGIDGVNALLDEPDSASGNLAYSSEFAFA